MKKDAEQFQLSLQRAAHGERVEGKLAPLVQTAQLASSLAEPPPPPPNQLASGRRRFLTEAARVRASKTAPPKRVAWKPEKMRFVGALMAAVLIFGMIFGAGYAAADSLPGEPLYALKLATEATRMQWTTNPEARADLAAALVAARLDEITRLMEQGQSVDEPIANRAKEQLALALQTVHQVKGQAALQASQRLENTLQVREQAMIHAASTLPEAEQGPVRDLLREIERVRQELHAGQGEPDGEQHRLRPGMPPEMPDAPGPAGQHGPGPQPEEPGSGPGPQPDGKPGGPEPDKDAGSGPGPWTGERPARPQPPAGPQPNEEPGSGPGPQPDEDPGSGPGPQPEEDPGSEPGHRPDEDRGSEPGSRHPMGPQPNEDPGSGPEPQPTAGSQPPEPPCTPEPHPSPGTGKDPGDGKP